jgi:hypothetical protein
MMRQDDRGPSRDVESYLRQLMAVPSAAGCASEPVALAAALAEARRVTAWGLRSAVELGRARWSSWRELADALDVPASTLHRQYRTGTPITTASDPDPRLGIQHGGVTSMCSLPGTAAGAGAR